MNIDNIVFKQPIVEWTWREKYRYYKSFGISDEDTIYDTHRRVANGVYALDDSLAELSTAIALMDELVLCPAGRIHSSAGTPKNTTSINCFVSPIIEDSIRTERNKNSKGIGEALLVAMETQQMGGGIGMNFSTLRPLGAQVKRTGSGSTGPLSFMSMWDAMCATIKSSGHRRGAMMATMRCDHPDILRFVRAKHVKGALENFNVSVLVTDAFMDAVANNSYWDLIFDVPKEDGNHVDVIQHASGVTYVYERVNARELWEEILKSTYEYAEPGVIFIDTVNRMNNLYYCEDIQATNPCGEQPLPPNGDCNLVANNLARLVTDPFTPGASFDFHKFRLAVAAAVRFGDNVIDTAKFPTPDQKAEAFAKRRIGLGVTGLANMLQQLQLRYGDENSLDHVAAVMEVQRDTAYRTSIELAKERGPFEAFNREAYLKGEFIKTLPEDIRDGIAEHGIRNGLLLTIAPTGTTSLYYGNVSSGIEPTFAWNFERKVRESNGEFTKFECFDYGYLLYKEIVGHKEGDKLPPYMVSALELPVEAHVNMQAICQKYVDSSISKTINCPKDMSYDDFKNVYEMAYLKGCKGCTTYRPSDVRGSVLQVKSDKPAEKPVAAPVFSLEPRPEDLIGRTYKTRFPGVDEAFYVTINNIEHEDGSISPFEIFINSKSVKHAEWIAALTRTISAIFRRGGDVTFIVDELKQVHSNGAGVFLNKQYVPSLVALIGGVIEKHFINIGLLKIEHHHVPEEPQLGTVYTNQQGALGDICPSCQNPTLIYQEGCAKCPCGYSECS